MTTSILVKGNGNTSINVIQEIQDDNINLDRENASTSSDKLADLSTQEREFYDIMTDDDRKNFF